MKPLKWIHRDITGRLHVGKVQIYFDFKDWWIGYYRGEFSSFVCPIPTLVFRWYR
jgi:hypothetical protein